MEYFIADTHFSHNNICGLEGFTDTRRHYQSTDEMDKALIKAWNKTVKDNDIVYHLGDFSMNIKPLDSLEYLRKLKGTIVLIKGNHDNTPLRKAIEKDPELSTRVTWHDVGIILKRNKKIIYLTHYPLITGSRGNLVNFHGHIHEMSYAEPNLINVGVDSPERDLSTPFGTPMSLETVLERLAVKQADFDSSNKTYSKHGIIE